MSSKQLAQTLLVKLYDDDETCLRQAIGRPEILEEADGDWLRVAPSIRVRLPDGYRVPLAEALRDEKPVTFTLDGPTATEVVITPDLTQAEPDW